MSTTVKLSAIVEAMDMQSDEMHQYLHLESGELYLVSDQDISYAEGDESPDNLPEWQIEDVERARKILETDDYVRIPDQSDIHEYQIMERFCLSLDNDDLREAMCNSIKKSGAFKRFKRNIRRCHIEKDWYQFRESAFYKIAAEYCDREKIPYIDDRPN